MAVYPHLYCILSDLGKNLYHDSLSKADLEEAYRRLEDWDSKNAVFVSPGIIKLLLKARRTFKHYSQGEESEFATKDARRELFEASLRLEQALR